MSIDWYEDLLILCSFLSYTVLAVTVVYKAPQVYAVLSSGSSRGISMPSLLLEFTSYTMEMTYQVGMGYPLETYFEIILMWGQDVILLYVVLENRHLIKWSLLPYLIVYSICFLLIAKRLLPDFIMYSLVSMTIPILTTSKLAQLIKIQTTKDPGQVSALTWSLLAYMAGVRVLTTAVITKDGPMFINVSSATILNIAIASSVIYFNYF